MAASRGIRVFEESRGGETQLTKQGIDWDDPSVQLENKKSRKTYNTLKQNQIHQASSVLEQSRRADGPMEAAPGFGSITSGIADSTALAIQVPGDGAAGLEPPTALMMHTARTAKFVNNQQSGTFLQQPQQASKPFAL